VRHSSFKLWLKYAKPTRGHADGRRGRARARCATAGRACCRSGIVDVSGEFDAATPSRSARRGPGRSARASATTTRGELRSVRG
jgi:hypothetical protein